MTVLTAVMIGGLLLIIALLVIRITQTPPALPDRITLPDGATAQAFTATADWYAVVTGGGTQILIFDRNTGALRQTVDITGGAISD